MVRRLIGSTFILCALALALAGLADATGRTSGPRTSVTFSPLHQSGSRPYSIVTGPDGNLWFTESGQPPPEASAAAIGRITPDGTITDFFLPDPNAGPYGIAVGADGNLWFTERFANLIGKMTPSGVLTEYPLGTPLAQPWDITALPNGDLWFTEENVDQVGVITAQGWVTE